MNTIKKAIKLVKQSGEPLIHEVVITTDIVDIESHPIYQCAAKNYSPERTYYKFFKNRAPDYLFHIVERTNEVREEGEETWGAGAGKVIYINPTITQYGLILTTYVLLHELGHYDTYKRLGPVLIPDNEDAEDTPKHWRAEMLADIYAFRWIRRITKRGYI